MPGEAVERLRDQLPRGALVGGAGRRGARPRSGARRAARRSSTGSCSPWASCCSCSWSALPLAAAAAVLLNLLATAAAFGAARLIFQEGGGEALLGFESQGFVDAWAPVFFFCLIFALAMDYTRVPAGHGARGVRAHRRARDGAGRGHGPLRARDQRGRGGDGGRVLHLRPSGPLPPKEMGVILGVGVLLDTLLVRLLLLPAALRLLGRRAWWTPRVLDRLLPSVRLRHG